VLSLNAPYGAPCFLTWNGLKTVTETPES